MSTQPTSSRDAADAAMAVPVTNDDIMTAVAQNASSAFATELRGAYVRVISADGTDQTAQINAALSAGSAFGSVVKKTVRLQGSFTLSAACTVHSGTTFDFSAARLQLAPNTRANIIRNAAVVPIRTVNDAEIYADSTTLTSTEAAFTQSDVGRTVSVRDANPGYENYLSNPSYTGRRNSDLIADIVEVVSATTVTLNRPAGHSVTATRLDFFNRDRDIVVMGGEIDRGANGIPYINSGVQSELDVFSTQFAHVDGLRISGITSYVHPASDGWGVGWQINMYDVNDFLVENIRGYGPVGIEATDLVHASGPASRGIIRNVFGEVGDDVVALATIGEPRWFPYNSGPVTDVSVENVNATTGTALLKVHGGGGQVIRGITARGIKGKAKFAVNIPKNTGNVLDLAVRDIEFDHTGTQAGVILAPGISNMIRIENIVWRTARPNSPIVSVANGSTIRNLSVEKIVAQEDSQVMVAVDGIVETLTVRDLDANSRASGVLHVLASGVVYRGICDNVDGRMRGEGTSVIYVAGRMDRFSIDRSRVSGAGQDLIRLATTGTPTLGKAVVSQVFMAGTNRVFAATGATDLTLNDLELGGATAGRVDLRNSPSGRVTVRGKGLSAPIADMFSNVNPANLPQVRSEDFYCDVSQVALINGSSAYNTNESLACGVGVVVASSTGWRNLGTGATYTP